VHVRKCSTDNIKPIFSVALMMYLYIIYRFIDGILKTEEVEGYVQEAFANLAFATVTEGSIMVTCKVCGERVSRGGINTTTFNTTKLVYYLRKKHPEEFNTCNKKKQPLLAVSLTFYRYKLYFYRLLL